MAEQIDWVLELVNGVSGPAKKALDDLKKLEDQAKKTTDAVENAAGGSGKAASGAHQLQGVFKQLNSIQGQLSGGFLSAGASAGVAGAAFAIVGLGVMAIADVAESAATAILGIGEAFAKSAIESAAFEESTRNTLANLMGDKNGEKALQDAKILAQKTQLTTQAVMEGTVAFSVSGLSPEEINKLNIGMADVAGMNSQNPMASRDFSRHMTEILTNGGHLMSLSAMQRELHLPKQEMLKNIGQAFNITPEEVEKNFKNLDGKGVAAAVLKTVAGMQKGGELGELTEGASRTVQGLFSTLSSRDQDFLGGFSLERGYPTFRNVLQKIADLTDPNSAMGSKITKGLFAILNGGFSAIFGSLDGEDGSKKIEKILNTLLMGFSYVGAAASAAFGGIEGFLEGLLGGSDNLFGDGGPLSEEEIKLLTLTMKEFGKEVGEAFKGATKYLSDFASIFKEVINLFSNGASNQMISMFAGHGAELAIKATAQLSPTGGNVTNAPHIEIHVNGTDKDSHEVAGLVKEHVNDALLKWLERGATKTGGSRVGGP